METDNTPRAKMTVQADLPQMRAAAFIEHLKAFQFAHPGEVQIEVLADLAGLSAEEFANALLADPRMTHQIYINGKRKT